MPLWGLTDSAANSVKYATELTRAGPAGSGNANKAANNTTLYANTVAGAFVSGRAVGQFCVTAQEMANNSAIERGFPQHAGWNMRFAGTGPVTGFNIVAGGTGYANSDLIKVSGGTINAAGIVTTNATGGLLTAVLSNPGAGFLNVSSSTLAITNATGGASAGTTANVTFSLGGRSGRMSYETIVAAGSFTSSGNTIPANT